MSMSSLFRGASVLLLVGGCSTYGDDLLDDHRVADGAGGLGRGGAQSSGGNAGRGGASAGSAGVGGSDAALMDAATDASFDRDADVLVDSVMADRDTTPSADAIPDVDAATPVDGSTQDADGDAPLDASADTERDGDGPSDAANDPIVDASVDGVTDGGIRDADAQEAETSGPLGPQTLPPHGVTIDPDAGAPFDSRCNANEAVTGFSARAGVHTDAIGAICSTFSNGALSAPRNLPLHGNLTGGAAETHTCPANYVAAGLVGRYGHNTMWDEDVLVAVGVVCRSLANPATTETVAITSQPALAAGAIDFREDCTTTRMLTRIGGTLASNSLGLGVLRVGGECNAR